ncbi:MAG: ABC transporter ATP-binding protein [Calditrichia bacterium]
MNALEVRHLYKSFGTVAAVKDVSFAIPEGAVFGLLGRNGAGKTSVIRLIMRLYLPDSGEIIFRGNPVGQEFRDRVSYLPEERGLYKKMKVLETLLFFAEIKGLKPAGIRDRAMDFLKRFDLADRANSRMDELSKGNQQKIQFIISILANPDFIILDEPFTGLDPINIHLLKDLILELRNEGKVLLLSTHLMDFAEKLCDHIAIMNHGEMVLSGNLSELKRRFGANSARIVADGATDFLKTHPLVKQIETFGNNVDLKVAAPEHLQDILQGMLNAGLQVTCFDADDISLQEMFMRVAGDVAEESHD